MPVPPRERQGSAQEPAVSARDFISCCISSREEARKRSRERDAWASKELEASWLQGYGEGGCVGKTW